MQHGHPAGRAERLDEVLAGLLTQQPGLAAVAVVTPDGLPMASALPAGLDEQRLAALSAALLQAAEQAAAGLGRGALSQVCVEGDRGTAVLVAAGPAVLVAVAAPGTRAGLLLWETGRAAGDVSAVLERAGQSDSVYDEQFDVQSDGPSGAVPLLPDAYAATEPTAPALVPQLAPPVPLQHTSESLLAVVPEPEAGWAPDDGWSDLDGSVPVTRPRWS